MQGHLKESDKFIQFIINLHKTHTPIEVFAKLERWIAEHQEQPRGSRLSQLVPTVGDFYTTLKLVRDGVRIEKTQTDVIQDEA